MQVPVLTRREQRGIEKVEEEPNPNDKPIKPRRSKAKAKSEPKKTVAEPKPLIKRPAAKTKNSQAKDKEEKMEKPVKPAPKRKSKSKATDVPEKKEESEKALKRSKSLEGKTDKETAVKKPKTGETEKGNDTETGGKRKTWASRWVPTCPIALKKFDSIRKVFEECCASKLRSQSTMQSPFFTQCTKAFASQNISDDAPMEDFIACAELQVDGFLASDAARCSAFNLC